MAGGDWRDSRSRVDVELRAGEEITSGFRIPFSRHLRPLLNREILTVAQLKLAVSLNRRGQI